MLSRRITEWLTNGLYFTGLVVDLGEVNIFGRAPKILRVDGHKIFHELGRVHGSKIVTLQVFA